MLKKMFIRSSIFILCLTFISVLPFDVEAQRRPSKKARNLFKKASRFYERRDYVTARDTYAKAIKISPKFPAAHFYKGSSHHQLKEYNYAIDEFNIALEQGYKPLDVYSFRMESFYEKGDLGAALRDAKEAAQLDPNNSYFHAFVGALYVRNSLYREGIDSLNKAINLGSKDANVYYFLAFAYGSVGDYIQQGTYATKAINGVTSFVGESWFLVGDSLRRDRQYEKARDAFINSLNVNDNVYGVYAGLGEVYRNLNQLNKSIDIIQKGLRKYRNDRGLLIDLSWYYSLADRNSEAIQVGELATKLAPNQFAAFTNLCRAYLYEGEKFYKKRAFSMAKKSFNKAVAECKKALRLKANDGETSYYLGRTYYFLDNNSLSRSYYRQSISGLQQSAKERPDYSDVFYLLGSAYYANKEYPKAIEAFEDALEISPRYARVRYNLGVTYLQVGNRSKAREQYSLLLTLDNERAKRLLARIENK